MTSTSPPDPHRHRERRLAPPAVGLPPPLADDESEFAAYAHMLRDHWRLVAGVWLAVFLAAVLVAVLARPVYQASMLIYVEETAPNTAHNALNDVAAMFETKKAASAEMELLRSRAVVGATVERLRMSIDARPDYFPVFGKLMRNLWPGRLSTPGLFGRGGQVWGSEAIGVRQLGRPRRVGRGPGGRGPRPPRSAGAPAAPARAARERRGERGEAAERSPSH